MEAPNRRLEDWYRKVQRGEIKLPSFQRFEEGDWRSITSMMNTIINNLPSRWAAETCGLHYKENGTRYPMWCDRSEDCLRRGVIPLS